MAVIAAYKYDLLIGLILSWEAIRAPFMKVDWLGGNRCRFAAPEPFVAIADNSTAVLGRRFAHYLVRARGSMALFEAGV